MVARSYAAEILLLVLRTLDLASDDDLSRFARLYGGSIQRLVAPCIQFFDRAVREPVGASALPEADKDAVVYEKGGEFTYLISQMTPWLQRRHRERILVDYLVSLTEGFMDERGIAPRQPRQPPAIAFLDLSGYTALAEERGDEAAASVAAVVHEVAVSHGGRPVKWLGDGVMMHFVHPSAAVVSGLDLVEETERAISAPARVGINAGAVVVQEGDYFRRTVNVAARTADYAGPREVLVSEEAREAAASADGVAFQLVGDVALKGVPAPVRLHGWCALTLIQQYPDRIQRIAPAAGAAESPRHCERLEPECLGRLCILFLYGFLLQVGVYGEVVDIDGYAPTVIALLDPHPAA